MVDYKVYDISDSPHLQFSIINNRITITFTMSLPLFLFFLTLTFCTQPASCPCQHGGTCLPVSNSTTICNCTSNYLDKYCTKQSTAIDESQQIFNITQEYSYYFTTFNASHVYFLRMFFCPLEFKSQSVFEIYIEIQDKDGGLEQDVTNKKVSHFRPKEGQCMVFGSILTAPQNKMDGNVPKIVARVRQLPTQLVQNNPSFLQNLAQLTQTSTKQVNSSLPVATVNTMVIKAYRYPIYDLQSLQIGQFLAVFALTVVIMFIIGFLLFRRAIQRRMARFHIQAAEAVRDISHFETLMPSRYHPKEQAQNTLQTSHQQMECMICLLGVEESYTRTTPCNHLFHKDCLDEWGRKSWTCPACRAPLKPADQNTQVMVQYY